jgi:hypothetical protein
MTSTQGAVGGWETVGVHPLTVGGVVLSLACTVMFWRALVLVNPFCAA